MGNALKSLRTGKGWTHDEAAKAMGISRGQFIKLERGERGLTQRTIDLAAKAFGVPASQVLEGEHQSAPRIPSRGNDSRVMQVEREGYRPPPELFGTRDLKVFAAVEAGPGTMVVSTEPIELVPRPWYLHEVKDGFAVLIVGDSMEPVYEAGDLAIINPRLPPMRGKDVILISSEHAGEFTASIKRLVSWTATHWHLRQFNPPSGQKATFTWSRADWPKALRVVGKYSGG